MDKVLSQYIEVLRRRWWLLLLGPVVAGVVAYSVSQSQTDIYQAQTTLLINHTATEGVLTYDDVLASEHLTLTYAELITQRPILTGVITELNLGYSEEDLRGQIQVAPVANTQLLQVRVKNADPVLASTIANTLSQDFIASNAAGSARTGAVSIVEAASPPTARVAPRVLLNTSMAIVVGLLVAVAIVVVLESYRVNSPDDYRVKSAEDMTKLGLVPLAMVPRFRKYRGKNGRKVDTVNTAWSTDSNLAEIYRFMRTNIEFATTTHPAQVFLVTSANPSEGTSTTATNLAVAMAKSGLRTVLVDANLRSPELHLRFGVPNNRGLTTLLMSDAVDFSEFILPTEVPDLMLIPSGPLSLKKNAGDLLASGGLRRFIERAKKGWDVVILDSPPLNSVADASLLAGAADATLLVIEADKTRGRSVTASMESLRRTHAWTVGAVLNKMTRRDEQFPPYGVDN